ncbi:MAG: hypothetical protein S4CHLAM2_17470 [Chlamydiales bacterium]|nr:hypothetical protein [Chlamydiales bacterium]
MLKKVGFIGAFLLGVFAIPSVFAQSCPPACPSDEPAGECYCKYVKYEPQCTYTKRCVEEQIPYTRKCCRYVPEYYDVQKCRYVPQYYTVQVQKCRYVPENYCEKKCRYVPQYYDVQEYKTCKKVICEPNYTCVPRYYWKHETRGCEQPCAPMPANLKRGAGGCASGKCGR